MHWFNWLLIAMLGLTAVLKVLIIGEPRKPLTRGIVAADLIVAGLLIAGIVAFR